MYFNQNTFEAFSVKSVTLPSVTKGDSNSSVKLNLLVLSVSLR